MDLPAGFRQAYEMVHYLSYHLQLNTCGSILIDMMPAGIGEFSSNG